MALISVAVALPIRMLLLRAFEKSNERDDEVLESWLEAPGDPWVPCVFGDDAHASWHFTGKRPVSKIIKWMALHPGEKPIEPVKDAFLAATRRHCGQPSEDAPGAAKRADSTSATSSIDGASSARNVKKEDSEVALARKLLSLAGFVGIYVAWAICSWFIFVRCSRALHACPSYRD